jgi:hypothetical protein
MPMNNGTRASFIGEVHAEPFAGGKANARTSIRTGKSEDLGWSAIHRCGARPAGQDGQDASGERGLLMAASRPFVVGDFRILISAIAMKGALNPLIRA